MLSCFLQRLQEGYKDQGFIKLDVGGNNFVVIRERDVVLTSYIDLPDGLVTSASVTPNKRVCILVSY